MRLTERLVEEHWPLTDVVLGNVLQESGERTVSMISSAEGRFVVKVSDQWRSAQVAERHAFIFEFLREAGLGHVPALVKTRTGRNYQIIGDHPVYILEFIEGVELARTPENCRRLGEIAGALHAIGGYPHNYLFTVADVLPEMLEIAEALRFGREYAQIVKALPDFRDLPVALIHGEILGNCVQRPDGRIVIVDWDEAGIGTRVLDLGHPLIQVFLSEDLDWEGECARGFYEGYFSRVQLDGRELGRIYDAGLFYALRYVIYGNTEKRWKRIQFALRNREWLESVVRDAAEKASLGSPLERGNR
jgi:Ser/Thr protein kinase RdoA (MazF antagonist)